MSWKQGVAQLTTSGPRACLREHAGGRESRVSCNLDSPPLIGGGSTGTYGADSGSLSPWFLGTWDRAQVQGRKLLWAGREGETSVSPAQVLQNHGLSFNALPPPKERTQGGGTGRGAGESCQHTPLSPSRIVIRHKDAGSSFLCRTNVGAPGSQSVGAKGSRSLGSYKGKEGGMTFTGAKWRKDPVLRQEIHQVWGGPTHSHQHRPRASHGGCSGVGCGGLHRDQAICGLSPSAQ